MIDAQTALDLAFDPGAFRVAGHALVDQLADYLERVGPSGEPSYADTRVLSPQRPGDVEQAVPPLALADGSFASLPEILESVIEHSNKLHHPGYIGHQVATVMPQAALVEAFNALLNNGMAVFEMGQMQTVMERRVLQFLAGKIGFGDDADGVLTHGGSLGNLTALLAARQAKCGHDVWRDGQCESLAVLVSEQAHYSVQRAAQVMGWGAGGAVGVESDECFRLRPERLMPALERARADGRKVVAVVASSCATATGSFDPIDAIADFCESEGLWLHVDGAHGASMALSSRYREPALRGIARAQSVVWDLHKLMMLPALSTAVVFRDGRRSYEAFAQQASYLFDEDGAPPERDWHDVGKRTLECTKRAMGVTAYVMLRVHGVGVFEANVDRLVDHARSFARLVADAPDFELAVEPECNIVCFRILPVDLPESDLDRHQARVRARVLDAGKFYIVQAKLLDGSMWLRITVMNPGTSVANLRDLLDEVRHHSAVELAE